MRRRSPWGVLALLFVLVPLVEIVILVRVGQAIGAWWTILLLVASGVLGAYLVRREGRRALRALQDALASHRMPARELADGALILVGGTLLLTPGFVTDAFGLFCILPFTRPVARGALGRVVSVRLVPGPGPRGAGPYAGPYADPQAGPGAGPGGGPGSAAGRGPDGPIVPGEVVD